MFHPFILLITFCLAFILAVILSSWFWFTSS